MLETEIVKLINAVEKLTNAMDALTLEVCTRRVVSEGGELPVIEDTPKEPKLKVVQPEQPEQPKNQDDASAPTFQDVKDATLVKGREGFRGEVRGLLSAMGVKKIRDIDEADYAEYLTLLGKIR